MPCTNKFYRFSFFVFHPTIVNVLCVSYNFFLNTYNLITGQFKLLYSNKMTIIFFWDRFLLRMWLTILL